MATPDPIGTQSVLRALDVLECFSQSESALSLSVVAERVGLTLPTTHRLLKALVARRFLVVNPETKEYNLGPSLTRLATLITQNDNILAVAVPVLQQLRDVTGETVSFHRLFNDERVCVAEFVSPHPIRMESGIGRAYPLPVGASGKALLAWLPPLQRQRILSSALPRITANSIVDQAVLEAELEVIREQGYALSVGEVVVGASALAVPIFGPTQSVIGAINVTGPTDRWTKDEMLKRALTVVEAARSIMHLTSVDDPRRGDAQRDESAVADAAPVSGSPMSGS